MSTKSRMLQLVSRRSRWLLVAFLMVASMFATTAPAAHATPVPTSQSFIGDVNGDGQADLIWNLTSATENRIFTGLSRGDGSFKLTQLQRAGGGGWQYYRTLTGDVNGDGTTDLRGALNIRSRLISDAGCQTEVASTHETTPNSQSRSFSTRRSTIGVASHPSTDADQIIGVAGISDTR